MILASVVAAAPWVIAPYLQLGADDQTGASRSLTLRWFAKDTSGYGVRYDPDGRGMREAPVEAKNRALSARLNGLTRDFRYEVTRNGQTLLSATAKAPPPRTSGYSAIVMGDSGRGLRGQYRLAQTLGKETPSLLVHTGDIVYPKGKEDEYTRFHFPVYNAEPGSPTGIPFLRRVTSVATPGNHDTGYRSTKNGLAYYLAWDQPTSMPGQQSELSTLAARRKEKARGNFSFAWGDSWWTVLDANPYRNWKSKENRAWLDRELTRGKAYGWRFVVWHQPGFHSSRNKEDERYMTSVYDLMTKHRVAVVFNGHVHNYQRTHPIRVEGGKTILDQSYKGDGHANGTITVVTGAGGAELYDQLMAAKPTTWKPFTAKYVAGYSFTRLEVGAGAIRISQIGIGGKVLDTFRIAR